MNRHVKLSAVIATLCLTWAMIPRAAAEQVVLRFRENPQLSTSVVRLDDLVEVLAGSSPSVVKLLKAPLGPSPRINETQTWRSSDVLQHLQLHGVHSASVRWSGAEVVTLTRMDPMIESQSVTPAFIDERIIEQARRNVVEAVTEYVNLKRGDQVEWEVEILVDPKYVKNLQVRRNIVAIGGGAEPWEGVQQLVIQVQDRGQRVSVPIRAELSLPPMIVAAARPIRKEEIITADALKYIPLPKQNRSGEMDYFSDLDALVGKQARRSISTGVALNSNFISDPIVVQRNDLVEVESVAGSVVVRSSAKALASGAIGDLVEIEMPSRHRIYATVVGQTLVRVSAVASRTSANR